MNTPESRAAKMIREIFESGRPLTYIRTAEEQRVGKVLREVGRRLCASTPVPVWTWSLTEGLRRDGAARRARHAGSARRARFHRRASGRRHLPPQGFPRAAARIGRDPPPPARRLRELPRPAEVRRHHFAGPLHSGGSRAQRHVSGTAAARPGRAGGVPARRGAATPQPTPAKTLSTSWRAPCRGSTLDEARYALRRALAASPVLGPESLPALLEEKRLLVNRSGVIEFISDGTDLGEVGGLEGLKKWLLERRKLFQMRDSLSAEIVPKGLLMMGIPGCGKSLAVKAIASYFQLPLYRVDMIEIFSGRHGKPEGAFVASLQDDGGHGARGAVVRRDRDGHHVDRIGRGAGPHLRVLPHLDAGEDARAVRRRHRQPHRPAARRNDPQGPLRRSVLRGPAASRTNASRSSRFTWTAAAWMPSRFNLEQLTQFTDRLDRRRDRAVRGIGDDQGAAGGPRGAEQDLINVAVKIVPLSRTMKEQINHIRAWAFERAVRASVRK